MQKVLSQGMCFWTMNAISIWSESYGQYFSKVGELQDQGHKLKNYGAMWKVLSQCLRFFRADLKPRLPPWHPSDLRHLWLLPCNRWTEFNEIWQKARTNCPLPGLCFSCRSKNKDDRPSLWLAETFTTFPLQPRNLTKSERKQLLNII